MVIKRYGLILSQSKIEENVKTKYDSIWNVKFPFVLIEDSTSYDFIYQLENNYSATHRKSTYRKMKIASNSEKEKKRT